MFKHFKFLLVIVLILYKISLINACIAASKLLALISPLHFSGHFFIYLYFFNGLFHLDYPHNKIAFFSPAIKSNEISFRVYENTLYDYTTSKFS